MSLAEIDDLALPQPPNWAAVSDYDRVRWPLADRIERKKMIGRAAMRQTEEFSLEFERRQRAEAEAKLKSDLPPEPDLEECRTLAQTNPDALRQIQSRTLASYRQCRALPAAPYRRIDHLWGNFRSELANKTASEMLFISLTYERTFLALAQRRNEFTSLSFQDEQARQSAVELAASEQQRLSGQAFDPSRFISSLASRGISLSVMSDGVSLRAAGNALAITDRDRDTIDQNRAAIVAALRLTKDI